MKTLIYEMLEKRGIDNIELLEKGINSYVEFYQDIVKVSSKRIIQQCLETFKEYNNEQIIGYFVNYDRIIDLKDIEGQIEYLLLKCESEDDYLYDKILRLRKEYIDLYSLCLDDITPFVYGINKLDKIITNLMKAKNQ